MTWHTAWRKRHITWKTPSFPFSNLEKGNMKTLTGYLYYPDSLEEAGGTTFCLVRSEEDNVKYLGVIGTAEDLEAPIPTGTRTTLYPLSPTNAAVLRQHLTWLQPQPVGLVTSAGFGDRMGLATPGHVRAVEGMQIAPIFAQQSVRENARTRRTPQQVIDDATWGVLQTGWRQPWGADADHLKTTADLDSFFDAGFTFFTIDPGEHVDNAAQTDPIERLREKVRDLPWDRLRTSAPETSQRYLGQSFTVENFQVTFTETELLRALAKYGRAIAHTLKMADHLTHRAAGKVYDLEVSVDETETPTSIAEHFFVASELKRLGVNCTSLAPRFIGRFEKGVDYIGDLAQFEAEFSQHAAIARHFGTYRLSLHSGSDKFSIYAIAARHTHGLLHLKTAGTSYLEALRVVARVNPELMRQILHLAIERYNEDRASYHVSALLEKVEQPDRVFDHHLPELLDQFDARQVFHVTFGAVLDRYGTQLHETLRANEDEYYSALEAHFKKHLCPLVETGS
jgi:tagaturonate epimerase